LCAEELLYAVAATLRLSPLQDAALGRAGERASAAVNPRLLLRGVGGAQTEISLATMAYNLKRMINVLGGLKLTTALQA
jgi:hypothetical protein